MSKATKRCPRFEGGACGIYLPPVETVKARKARKRVYAPVPQGVTATEPAPIAARERSGIGGS